MPANNWEHNEGRPPSMADVNDVMNKLRPASTANPPVNGLNLHNMQKATKGGYPKFLYHETLEPQYVTREDQELELAQLGYVTTYIPRSYPRTLFRRNPDPRFAAKFAEGTGTLTQTTEHQVEERIVRDKEHEARIRKERRPAGASDWVYRLEDLPAPPEAEGEDPAVTIARLEGQLAEARESKKK